MISVARNRTGRLAAALGMLVLVAAVPATASILGTNTMLSTDPFTTANGWSFVDSLSSDWLLADATVGSSTFDIPGRMHTLVLTNGAGLFAYIYSVEVDPDDVTTIPSPGGVRGVSIPVPNPDNIVVQNLDLDGSGNCTNPGDAGCDTSYYITDTTGDLVSAFFATGNTAPGPPGNMPGPSFIDNSGSYFTLFQVVPMGDIVPEPNLNDGDISHPFGIVTTQPPGPRFANIIDTGSETSPKVLVPAPEPGSIFLLGAALAGLAVGSRRRRKS